MGRMESIKVDERFLTLGPLGQIMANYRSCDFCRNYLIE
jgi:hypothetical protein